jgi:hypothetical protein
MTKNGSKEPSQAETIDTNQIGVRPKSDTTQANPNELDDSLLNRVTGGGYTGGAGGKRDGGS